MVWGFIAAKVIFDLFGPAKKSTEESSSSSSSSHGSYQSSVDLAESLHQLVQARQKLNDTMREAAEAMKSTLVENDATVQAARKPYLTISQQNKVRYAISAVNREDEWIRRLYTSLVFSDENSTPLYVEEIEEAIQILVDSGGDVEQIELLQASIPRLQHLWVVSRQARSQHENDRILLGEWNVYQLYTEGGSEAVRASINTMPEELQAAAQRVLEFYEFVYLR